MYSAIFCPRLVFLRTVRGDWGGESSGVVAPPYPLDEEVGDKSPHAGSDGRRAGPCPCTWEACPCTAAPADLLLPPLLAAVVEVVVVTGVALVLLATLSLVELPSGGLA